MLAAWIAAYLATDAGYVWMSRGAYLDRVAAVAGSGPKDGVKIAVCAIAAYVLMALGWATIVLPEARKAGLAEGAKIGALYGLVVYGIFNATTGSMFDAWTWGIMARDVSWGVLSLAAWTGAYAALA